MLNDSTLICRILICFHYFFQLRNGGGGGEVDPKRLGEVGERSSSLRLTPPGCGTLDSRKDPAAGMITRRFTFLRWFVKWLCSSARRKSWEKVNIEIFSYKRPWKTSSFPMKLMKMSKLRNFFTSPKIIGKCSKLHSFSSKTSMKYAIISVTKSVWNYSKLFNLFGKRHSVSEELFKRLPKSPFSLATPQLHEDLEQTGSHIQTTPRIPSFWQGVMCHIWPSQFGGHREQTRGVRLGI